AGRCGAWSTTGRMRWTRSGRSCGGRRRIWRWLDGRGVPAPRQVVAVALETEAAVDASLEAGLRPPESARLARWWRTIVRSVAPVILALIAGGLLLLALGRNPVRFYVAVWQGGIELGGWQNRAVLMAPLLLIALGLIIVFRAGIWNLGYDGQYLLGAALVAGVGPSILPNWPTPIAYTVLFLMAGCAGALWTVIPALLKAWYETN